MDEPVFLTYEQVLEIHAEGLRDHGGQDGVRDNDVIEAVVASPRHTMFGEYLHEDVPAMAAAYLFGFAASQGFVDGNKRTAVSATFDFLAMNGWLLECSTQDLYEVAMLVAKNLMDKYGAEEWIRARIVPMP